MHYDKLIFGATLDSLFYSLRNGYPLVYSIPSKPFALEEEANTWKQAYFFLSLAGFIPFADNVKRTKLLENNKLELLTEKKRFEVSFDELVVFDDKGLSGLPQPIGTTSDIVEVYDWFRIIKCPPMESGTKDFQKGFVEKFYFYDKPLARNSTYKDLVSKSTLPRKELQNEECSELFSRFKSEELLSQHLGKPMSLKSQKREIIEIGKNIYEPIEGVIFLDEKQKIEYISDNAYLTKIMEYMGV